MKRLFYMTGVLMTLLFPLAAMAGPSAKGDITRLKNGFTVCVIKDTRFPLVSTRLYVHAGSAYETPEIAGISHLLEHMVFKGTKNRPNAGVARDIENVGGSLNAATSFDYTVYLNDLPAAHWKLGMDVVKDMAFNATIDPKDLEAEKPVVISELQRGEDSPGSLIFQSLQAKALKGTPYERPIIGYKNIINSITPEQIHEYINKFYQPQSMLLMVVGDVDPQAVLAEAEAQFGDLVNTRETSPPAIDNPEELMSVPALTVKQGAWNKIYLGAAFPVPGDLSADSAALEVLGYMLGGDNTSLLYKKYKYEKQMVQDISADYYGFERVGMFYITAELDADKLEPFWAELTKDMAALKASDFSSEALARAKINIEDSLQRRKETLSGLASTKGQLLFFHGREAAEDNIISEIRNVSFDQVEATIKTWLRSDHMAVSVLTPKDFKTPPLLDTLKASWPAPPVVAKADSEEKSGVETLDLGHGRTMILINDPTMPYTSINFVMPGGEAVSRSDRQGVAMLAARSLTKGAGKRNAVDIERFLADRASSLNASAGRQTFALSAYYPARFASDILPLMRETLSDPTFAEEEINREKESQIASIKGDMDSPMGLASQEMPPFLFPGTHPYGFRVTGQIKDVERYNASNVRHFWERQIRMPWFMAVAGQFDRNAMIEFARSLPIPKDTGLDLSAPAWGKDKDLTLHLAGRNQAHLFMIFKTVPATSPDAPGLDLLQRVLAGQSGILFTELRDKQSLGYTVTAFNRMSPLAGYMAFYIGTTPDKIDRAEAGFDNVISGLKNTLLSGVEIAGGKNQMESSYYRRRQTIASRSAEAAGMSVLGRPLDFPLEQIKKAQQLTAEDLQNLAKKYLDVKNAYVIKVMP